MNPSQQLLEFKRRQIQDHWNLNRKPFGHILPHTISDYVKTQKIKKKEKYDDVACGDDVAVMDDNPNTLESFFTFYS